MLIPFVILLCVAAGVVFHARNSILATQLSALSAAASRAAGTAVALTHVELDTACRVVTVSGSVEVTPGVRLLVERAVVTDARELLLKRTREVAFADVKGELRAGERAFPVTGAATARWEPDGGARITGHVATAASRLEVRLQADSARTLSESRVTGKVARADLDALGLLEGVPLAGEADVMVDARVEGSLFDPSLHAELFAAALQLRVGAASPYLEHVTAKLALSSRAWRLSEIAGRWGGAQLTGELANGPVGHLALDGWDADGFAQLLRELALKPRLRVMRAGAPATGFPVPPDLRAVARFAYQPGAPVGVTLAFTSDTSQVWLTGGLTPRAPEDWKISGRLSTRDLDTMEWFAPVRIEPDGECFLDLAIGEKQRIAGTAQLAAFFGGRLNLRGWVDGEVDPAPYHVRAELEGVDAGALPLGAAANRLGAHLTGALSGHVDLDGYGTDLARLTGEGALTLSRPRYPGLRALESTVATYGLPLPPLDGTVPAAATLAIEHGAVAFKGLDARVEGVAVHGDVALHFDGDLVGQLDVDLAPGYLRQSNLLLLPAAIARSVRIPVALSGTVSEPESSADLKAALGHWMKDYSLGNITEGLSKNYELGSLTRGILDTIDRLRPGQRLQPGPELDRVFERILSGEAGAGEMMDQLSAAGVSAFQLQDWLADFRRRRGRNR